MRTKLLGLLAVGMAFAYAVPASAATVSVESGGITLNSYDTTTAGTVGDAWLIDESMTAPGTLEFAGVAGVGGPLGAGNSSGSGHNYGKWIWKSVTNNTGVAWTSFELELQATLGTPSGQGDGLSFADGSALALTFTSDVFSNYSRIDDTRDYLNFWGGTVNDGETVTFKFLITDNRLNDPFWLLQTANKVDVPPVPLPAAAWLLLSGLGGLGVLGRRRKAA